MTMGPVSVVIPTYNRRAMVRRALRSVLAQRDVEFEVVVVDDGSTDGTDDYLGSVNDNRVSVIRLNRVGVALARNAGIDAARGEWVSFLDDDDLWAPDKLACQFRAAALAPESGWIGTGIVIVTPRGRIVSGMTPAQEPVLPELFLSNFVPAGPSTVMVRRELIHDLGGFDGRLHTLADWDMWIRLALAAPLAAMNRPLVAYSVHRRAMSRALVGLRRELELVEAKHRSVREASGVHLPHERLWRLEARIHMDAGRRRSAFYLVKGRRALGGRAWPIRAGLAAVCPRYMRATWMRHQAGLLPDGWMDEARGWLESTLRGVESGGPQARRLSGGRPVRG